MKIIHFNLKLYFFRQKKGTAMGTKVAPTCATLTIGYLERKLFKNIPSEFGPTFSEEFENTRTRFLDDCLFYGLRVKTTSKNFIKC